MIGNIDYIIYNVSKKHPELPREFIEDLYYEYWKQVKKSIQYSERQRVYLYNLGTFQTKNNKLRSYLRWLISEMRWIKKRRDEVDQPEGRLEFYTEQYKKLCNIFRTSWKQLEEARQEIIYKNKKRIAWKEYYDELDRTDKINS